MTAKRTLVGSLHIVMLNLILGAMALGQTPVRPVKPVAEAASNVPSEKPKYPFPVTDMRGKGEPNAVALASTVSKKGFIALLVRGNDITRIENAIDTVEAVYASGRTRVGLIIGDGDLKLWEVYADGERKTFDDKADSYGFTQGRAGRSMVAQYDKYIGKPPSLANPSTQGNTAKNK